MVIWYWLWAIGYSIFLGFDLQGFKSLVALDI
jgi:hypothetical protein